jgi:hypothetical protein
MRGVPTLRVLANVILSSAGRVLRVAGLAVRERVLLVQIGERLHTTTSIFSAGIITKKREKASASSGSFLLSDFLFLQKLCARFVIFILQILWTKAIPHPEEHADDS